MRIYKYTIEYKDTDIDFPTTSTLDYFLEADIESTFPEIKLELQAHSFDYNSFFFIADDEDQKKMFDILLSNEKSEHLQEFCGGFSILSEDFTDEVLNNIDKYDNIENFVDRNNLLEYYNKVFDKDSVLDKILERGIDSLNEYDKNILKK